MSAPAVVHLVWGGEVGGIERLVHDLASEQSGQGIEVAVAFGQAHGFFHERIRERGVPVIDLALRSGYDLRPGRIARGAELLARFGVVHAHGFNLPLGQIMRRARAPVVFTEHGQFGLGRSLGLSGRLKLRAQRRFLDRRCAAIAANSDWTADRLALAHSIARDRVSVVHNGIRLPSGHAPAPRRGDRDELVVVFVGRLKRFKRVDRLVHAVARLRAADRVRVLIAGGGPLEGELRALVARLGIEARFEFLGWTPDVGDVLRRADVLALPSDGEPFGLALVEGCAEGLLPIAFADGGGALECMPPDGVVVANVDELASVLGEVGASDALSESARAARAAWARAEFPIAKTAARYLELYRAALDGPARGARPRSPALARAR